MSKKTKSAKIIKLLLFISVVLINIGYLYFYYDTKRDSKVLGKIIFFNGALAMLIAIIREIYQKYFMHRVRNDFAELVGAMIYLVAVMMMVSILVWSVMM